MQIETISIRDFKALKDLTLSPGRVNVFIGANTTILYNVSIGSNTIIAAGSVVNKSLKGGGVYAGVPARYICSIEDFMKKRNNAAQITVSYSDDGLSDKTIKAAWKRFRENDEAKERYTNARLFRSGA